MPLAPVIQPFNQYLTELPGKSAESLGRKALLYSVIEKISVLAIAAIIGSIYFVSYNSIALTGTLPLIFVGMTFSTIFFVWAMSQFRAYANQYYEQEGIESKVDDQLKSISHWSTERIHEFLRAEGIDPGDVPVEDLRHLNEREPFKALLPLIARYLFLKDSSEKLRKISIDALHVKIEEDLREAKNLKGPIPETQKQTIRFYARDTFYRNYEYIALPRLLEASYLLQIVKEPRRQFNILSIGEFTSKVYAQRMFDRFFPPKNDTFFVFHNRNKEPITLAQIEQNPNPARIRPLLFA